MAKTFRPYEPDQMLLMPPALQDWLPENHLARFVSDVIDSLDLSGIEERYEEEKGYPPYHPRMMVKVLVYGYCTGVYSSRRLEKGLQDSVAFRFLGAGNEPDFRTINRFRLEHGPALAGLFEQVLELCREAGMVKLGRVAIDGTKIKANASKHKAMSYGRMKKVEKDLKQEVRALLAEADRVDGEEDAQHGRDRRGDELPEELARRETRLKKIREAKRALEAEARKKAQAEGKDPDDAQPPDKAQRNFTDPESKIQKTNDGFIQGYNAQVAVDDEHQVIVAQHVTSAAPDVQQLAKVIENIESSFDAVPDVVLADAGYCSEENVDLLESKGIESYIATRRQKHGEMQPLPPRGRIPDGLTVVERMERKLRTVAGRKQYSRRKVIVEPAIGQIKSARGFRSFLRRGLTKVNEDFAMICAAHNLLKLFRVVATC